MRKGPFGTGEIDQAIARRDRLRKIRRDQRSARQSLLHARACAYRRAARHFQRARERRIGRAGYRLDQGPAHAAGCTGNHNFHCAAPVDGAGACAFASNPSGTTSPSTRFNLESSKNTANRRRWGSPPPWGMRMYT